MAKILVKMKSNSKTELEQLKNEQYWCTRYRGPFDSTEEAEQYCSFFRKRYPNIEFKVVVVQDKVWGVLSQHCFDPLIFRPHNFSYGFKSNEERWANGDTFGHGKTYELS